jgi:BNR/Asp-box repeat protein
MTYLVNSNGDVLVALSTDGGGSFTKVADVQAKLGDQPSGRVYLVWTQETPNESDNTDIMLQRSDDNGATWSPAAKLNDDHTTNSQYDPAIALDQTSGDVAVSWYDTRNDLGAGRSGDTDGIPNDDFQIWATDSTDGGATFAPNFRVSQGTSNAIDANTSSTLPTTRMPPSCQARFGRPGRTTRIAQATTQTGRCTS